MASRKFFRVVEGSRTLAHVDFTIRGEIMKVSKFYGDVREDNVMAVGQVLSDEFGVRRVIFK